jgi:hypothetical protein
MPEPVTLELLAKLVERCIEEQAATRADLAVLTAITQRIDGTLSGLVNEIRATHTQQSRFDRRLRKLEGGTEP